MKKKVAYYLTTLLLMVTGLSVSAQKPKIHENPAYGPDSVSRMECARQLSIINQYVKINTLEYAFDAWKYTFTNCPKSSKNIYIHGSKILKYNIDKETDPAIQEKWVDTLMMMYDQRIVNFGQPGYVNGLKGVDLLRYRKSAVEEAYGYLEKSVNSTNEKVDESVAVTYISTTYVLMQQGILTKDIMVNNYVKVIDLLEQKIADGDTDEKIPQAIEGVEQVFAESGAADCETLVSIFTPKFLENSEDIQLLKKVTGLLAKGKCEKTELYAQTAEKLYQLEPSAEAASNLGGLFAVKEQYDKAVSYYKKAIADETDTQKKAMYNFQLARVKFQTKDYAEVRQYCLAAISLKPDFGDAYILIGSAYAASSSFCGSSDFEKQAVYWAAVDKFAKAKSVDPSVAGIADEQIRTFTPHFPNNEDAFFNGYTDGKSYTVGCWINETTTVRTRK